MKPLINNFPIVMTMLSALLLTGCNDGESKTSSGGEGGPPTGGLVLSAENAVDPVQNDTRSTVMLKNKVHSSQPYGDNFVTQVTAVTQLPECQDISFDKSGYTARFDEFVGVCVYKYDAANSADADASTSAYSIVAVQSAVDSEVELFRPISKTTLVEQPVTIDLKSELLGQVPEGYTLSEEVTQLGNGAVLVDTSKELITFTPTGAEGGYARLIYSYSNGDNIKMGNISVSVSSTVNGAPEAPNIDYSADPDNPMININEQSIIDLTPYVSDPDGDALQLVDVNSWNAAVSPSNPEDMNNLKINFISSQVGEQFVYYVISDHFGGYATGEVRVEVYDPKGASDWGNLKQGMNLYYGPLTKVEADAKGIEYTSTNFDENGANVPTFNVTQAQASCNAVGRLPTRDELIALYGITEGGPAAYDGWPVDIGYYAKDGTNVSVVDLSTGQVAGSDVGGQYVTCVGEGGFLIDTAESDIKAVANGEDKAKIVARVTLNGAPVSGVTVSASVDGSATIDQSTVTTDRQGDARFLLEDIKAEVVTVAAQLGENVRSQTVTFTGDKATAEISSVVTVNNQNVVNGVNTVTSTLNDTYGNSVEGESIDFTVDQSDAVVIGLTDETDSNGEQTADIRWVGDTDLSVNPVVYVTSRYVRPDSVEVATTKAVTFAAGYLSEELEATLDGSQAGEAFNVVTAYVTNKAGAGINDAEVQFYIDNKNVMSVAGERNSMKVRTEEGGEAILPLQWDSAVDPRDEDLDYQVYAKYGNRETVRLSMKFTANELVVNGRTYKQIDTPDYDYDTVERHYCSSIDPTYKRVKMLDLAEQMNEAGTTLEEVRAVWWDDESMGDPQFPLDERPNQTYGGWVLPMDSLAYRGRYTDVLWGEHKWQLSTNGEGGLDAPTNLYRKVICEVPQQ